MIDACKPAEKLFIGIPCYDGKVTAQTFSSITAALVLLGKAENLTILPPLTLCGNCYLDDLRNQIMAEFKESGATDCILIDSDVGFVPKVFVDMVAASRPIVGAIYPKKTDVPSWPVELYPGDRYADEEGLIEVKMVPTGLLRINRAVLAELDKPEFGLKRYQESFRSRELVAYFENDIRDRYYGEDVEFSRRWRENGGNLRIVADAFLSHTGPKTWTGNIGAAMKDGQI